MWTVKNMYTRRRYPFSVLFVLCVCVCFLFGLIEFVASRKMLASPVSTRASSLGRKPNRRKCSFLFQPYVSLSSFERSHSIIAKSYPKRWRKRKEKDKDKEKNKKKKKEQHIRTQTKKNKQANNRRTWTPPRNRTRRRERFLRRGVRVSCFRLLWHECQSLDGGHGQILCIPRSSERKSIQRWRK